MLIRHGDRTPLTQMNTPLLKFDQNWHCDLQEASKNQSFSALAGLIATASEVGSGDTPGPKVAMFLQHLPMGASSRLCARAQMTPQGWMQHIILGQHMRAAYLGTLFSQKASWRDSVVPVVVYSTANSRTQQSAYAFMYGLLPDLQHRDGNRVQKVGYINFCHGIMCNCPAVIDLGDIKDKIQSNRRKDGVKEVLQEIEQILLPMSSHKKKTKKMGLPGVGVFQENFFAALCHNKSLPCGPQECITADHVSKFVSGLEAANEELRADDNSTHIQYGRLYMHPLLSAIAGDMEKVAFKKKKKPHFTLYSGHDLTVMAMIDALGFPDHRWPYYASHLNFELWMDNFSQHYLRVLYNGKDHSKHLRFCRRRINKDGLCPLQYFLSFIEKDNIQYFKSNSYAEACQQIFRYPSK